MADQMRELKPCPFCGSTRLTFEYIQRVGCMDCGATVVFDDKQGRGAIALWNARAALAAIHEVSGSSLVHQSVEDMRTVFEKAFKGANLYRNLGSGHYISVHTDGAWQGWLKAHEHGTARFGEAVRRPTSVAGELAALVGAREYIREMAVMHREAVYSKDPKVREWADKLDTWVDGIRSAEKRLASNAQEESSQKNPRKAESP